MDFLTLCQKTAFESGVVSGTQPTTVTGQTGLLGKIVGWVADAWTWIQGEETTWRWMRADWEGELSVGEARYTADSFDIDDFGAWITDDVRVNYKPTTIYLTATGVSDEVPLKEIEFVLWEERYNRGTVENGRPLEYAISDDNEICFGPPPDAAYTVRGKCRLGAVTLTNNTDEPACPARFHMAIVWEANRRLALHDESWNVAQSHEMKRDGAMAGLRLDQLPRRRIRPGKLA